MTYQVVSTENWTFERLAPFVPQVMAGMRALTKRFPDHLTPDSLFWECVSGKRHLWLILDGEGAYRSFLTTTIEVVDATGKRLGKLKDLAGDVGLDAQADIYAAVEGHFREQAVDTILVEGREGWGKALEPRGYRKHAVLWRKAI